jgi:hypothetical protein
MADLVPETTRIPPSQAPPVFKPLFALYQPPAVAMAPSMLAGNGPACIGDSPYPTLVPAAPTYETPPVHLPRPLIPEQYLLPPSTNLPLPMAHLVYLPELSLQTA